MKKLQNKQTRSLVNKRIIFSLVCLVLGFILAYSYSLSSSKKLSGVSDSSKYFEKEESYREDLIHQKERNKELENELVTRQLEVREIEKSLSGSEEQYESLVGEAEDLRLLMGMLPATGEGVKVQLQDAEYNPASVNPNDYIVHESHVFQVLNELKISGAEAITINGQRLHANSYIKCNGPVITVDGQQFPAPFIIEAIGDPSVLVPSLQLTGGVLDQLVNDNIVVTIEKKSKVQMPAL
ncbi:DUF881 domain-containing protein [Paenisporosarcina antarctica]|uniref:DUF881 domain-containing protein n=1 Tax=Paenisporosarcina antarctica TaxID=417367 RepID=A0A4P6ZYP4_9BACL|nr:DUF881 domain-containing protein [Paenisporosarcina antarctica]QBP41542.1 DUF881 domain-containing protein [Paenisporosarcina antarctica]